MLFVLHIIMLNFIFTYNTAAAKVAETQKCLFKINLIILQRNVSAKIFYYMSSISNRTSKTMPNLCDPKLKYSPFKLFSL